MSWRRPSSQPTDWRADCTSYHVRNWRNGEFAVRSFLSILLLQAVALAATGADPAAANSRDYERVSPPPSQSVARPLQTDNVPRSTGVPEAVRSTYSYALATMSPQELRRNKREASQGSALAQFRVADSFDKCDPKQFPKAAKWYAKAARQGYAPAQNALGLMYWFGRGVRRNEATAFALFQSAANSGFSSAQHNLGLMYLDGTAGIKNEALGDAWLRVAAAGGNHVSASTRLQVEASMDRTTLARALDLAGRLAVHFQVQLALAQ